MTGLKKKIRYSFGSIYSRVLSMRWMTEGLPLTVFKCGAEVIEVATCATTNPPKLEIHNDCIFLPQYNGVYDQNGNLIESSALSRGKGLKNSPRKVELPKLNGLDEIEVATWGGLLFPKHYGHFLTESVSRLWPFTDKATGVPFQPCPVLFRGASSREFTKKDLFPPAIEIFNVLGIYDDLRIEFSPLRIKKIYIPEQSVCLGRYMYSTHANFLGQAGRLILKRSAYAQESWNGAKVYLSRAKLPPYTSRKIANEYKLEDGLKKLGFRIVYPEELTLADQIAMFSWSSVIVGSVGSAFFSLLLARPIHLKLIFLTQSKRDMIDYANIGELQEGVDQWFIQCVKKHPLSFEHLEHRGEKVIDGDASIQQILSLIA